MKNQDRIEEALEEGNKIADELDKLEAKKSSSKPKALSRESLIEELNEIIEENDGVMIEDEDILFSELGLDSFGATIFFLELDDRYNYCESESQEDFMKNTDWKRLKVKTIIDNILCS
tara:strand:+ start:42249 stop:42602 length:354 start_codon:yes stop_codon:yes gene_type:complete